MPTIWTTPITWVTGTVTTTADMNAQIRDNMLAINSLLGHPSGSLRSLTDGGVLLGAGTGSITALPVLAKGMLVVGDGTAAPGTLAVGANDTYLIADSAQTLGVKWGSPTVVSNPEDIMKFS